MSNHGKLITVEGIEGVGKSSNVAYLASLIEALNVQVVVTREPGGTPIAEAIRKILLADYDEQITPGSELLLFYAGRLQHVEHVIKPALSQGKWVICDRFIDATYAYQGGGRGIDIAKIASLNQWVLGSFSPDLTILLDAPIEVAFERIRHHRQLDRFEKEEQQFFEKVRQQYLAMAKQEPARFRIIDASKTLEDVQAQLRQLRF